ncbi:MAG TPA: pyridoxal 5'-phosphate synthase glutaminase subunit PdxT [Acidimicrobiia bacterium]|nr:pyridoxal 5'-phosphate synthase glutaminase subunit PdxT [Acidimicrobiia bacterium]
MSVTRVGVLALQGDVREHLQALAHLGTEAVPVKSPEDLESVEGLVIPGGESTTIGKLSERFGLLDPLRRRIDDGMAVFGTCAGLIFLSAAVTEGSQPLVGRLDVMVRRNAFGRQNDSFEADLDVAGLDRPFHAVFIRAPWVEKVGAEVEVLARVHDHPVMVRQGRILGASFHPELTADDRIHRIFVDIVEADAQET